MALAHFIQDLKIEDPPEDLVAKMKEASATPGSGKGFADEGSMVSFTSQLTGTHKSDVLNSTLLAQLSADNQFDRLKDTDDWYKYYVYVLGKIGWDTKDFKFEQYSTSGPTVRVSNAIIDIAKTMLTPEEVAVVQKTIDGLNASDNNLWWAIFDRKSSGTTSIDGNFQVAPCKEDSSGQVMMTLISFYFTATYTEKRWMWFDFSTSSMSLFKGTQVCTLNDSVYGPIRQQVIDKLGNNAKVFIGDLDI